MGEGSPESAGGLLTGFGPGRRVAGYLLEDQLGAGGMAVVFRAVDERLSRRVALKIMAPALAADAAYRKRFIRESQAAAAVDDPHIIPVYEAGEAEGVLFIAMRLVPGRDVRTLLADAQTLSPGRVAAIISPVASALDAAHAAGLVHRDVKPGNMLIDARPDRPDHVYLSDFGLSKGASSVGMTGTGVFLGTPSYSAPEQILGHQVDGRADQYALGCAAFELLAGQPPFERDQGMAVLLAHLNEPPPSPRALRPELPAEVDDVFARALAKQPQERYPTCREFAEALRAALGLLSYNTDPDLVPGPRQPPDAAVITDHAVAPAGPRRPDPGGRLRVPTQLAAGDLDSPTMTVGGAGALRLASAPRRASRDAAEAEAAFGEAESAPDDVIAVAFGPDGTTLAIGDSGGHVYLCDPKAARRTRRLAVGPDDLGSAGDPVAAMAFSSDDLLVAAACADGSTRVWAVAQRELIATLANPDSTGVNAMAFSPDRSMLAVGDENGHVYLWQVTTARLARVVASPESCGVCAVAFSPDGSMLAAGDGNGRVDLWTASGDRLDALLEQGDGEVFAVAFTPDSSVLATGDSEGNIGLWDPSAATRLSMLTRPGAGGASVFALAFSQREPLLAAGYSMGGACLWDAERGRFLTALGKPNPGPVLAVAFSAGGKLLATGHPYAMVALWDGASGWPVATV